MAEDQGGGVDLGSLEVAIVGSTAPLEDALTRAEEMLAAFDKKFGTTTAKSARAAGRVAKANASAPAQTQDAPKGVGGGPARNVNVAIKTEGVRKDIEGQLGGEFKIKIVTEDLKLNVDQAHLRGQVIEALKGINVGLGGSDVRPGAPTGGFAAPASPQVAAAEQMRRAFPPEVVQSLKQIKGLGDAIDDLHSVIGDSLQFAGQPGLPQRGEGETLDKLADVANRFGLSNAKLVEYLNAEGRPTTKVSGGPLGPKGAALAGLDPGDISQIGKRARIVSELSKGSAFLTKFFDALPGVGAASPPPPPPAPREMPAAPREEPAAAPGARGLISPTSPEASAARGKIMSREDFVDYVRSVAGPSKGALPAASSIAIPASRVKGETLRYPGPFRENLMDPNIPGSGGRKRFETRSLGDVPIESLQAAKTSAGRRAGIQGNLGPLQAILSFAERGGFENFAEIQKNRKPTGRYINYDPETTQGARVRKNRVGIIGEDEVRAANPRDLLERTLKALHPGIEARSNPTDPMSSLLERVLAGPGAQAIAAGKRLAVPSRSTASEEPSQTSRAPAGGPLASGSAGSLRRGYQEAEADIEADPRMRRGRRAQALAGMRLEGQAGLVAAARRTGGDPADALGGVRDTMIAIDKIKDWVSEVKATVTTEQARASGAVNRNLNQESRSRINVGVQGQAYERSIEADYTRREMYPKAPPGGYIDILKKLASITGTSPKGLPESYRSVMLSPTANAEDAGTYGRSTTGEIQKPVFSGNAIRRLIEEHDQELYDALGLEGQKRKPKSLPDYQQAERSAVIQAVYGPQQQAEADVMRRGEGSGGLRPRKESGRRVTGFQTDQGTVETEPEYEKPVTSLDVREQQLQGQRVKAQKEQAAALAAADAEADRRMAARFGGRERRPDRDLGPAPVGPEAYTFANRATQQQAEAFYARSQAALRRRVGGGTGAIDEEIRGIRGIRGQANAFLGTIAKLPGSEQRPAVDRASLSEAVRKEVLEVLEHRQAQTARQPGQVHAREPLSGDKFAAAVRRAGGRATETNPAGGGPGGVGIGPGGRSFAPGGAPIEVIVVGKFPLAVEMVGEGRGGGGYGRKPPTGEGNEAGQPGQPAGPRGLRRKNINARDVGTAADAGKIYTFEPDEENESTRRARAARSAPRGQPQATAAERDFLASLQTVNRPGPTEEQQEIKAMARQRRLRTRARLSDPLEFARLQDLEEQGAPGEESTSLGAVRARLRSVNRRIPRRGFGASLTDLLSTMAPGSKSLEEQLRFGDLAAREAAEIEKTSDQRSATRTTLKGLPPRIAEARAKGDTEQLKNLLQVQKEQRQALENQNQVIRISTERFKEFSDEATKGSRVFKSFGASAIGGAAAGGLGALQFAAGAVIAQPLMQAVSALFSDVIGPGIEQALSFPGATSKAVGAQVEVVRGVGGRQDIALAQLGLQTGNTLGQAGQTVNQRAALEAGNQALAEQVGLLRASINIGQNGGPEAALTQSLGGLFGGAAGGTPSIDEIIGKQLQLNPSIGKALPTSIGRAAIPTGAVAGARGQGSGRVSGPASLTPEQIDSLGKNLDGLNKIMAKGSNGIDKFVSSAEIGAIQIERQAQALQDAGFTNIAQAVRNRQGVLMEQGRVVTDPNQIKSIFKAVTEAATKTTPADFLAANKDAFKAQLQIRGTQLRLQTGTLLPQQAGIEAYENPLPKASAGINTSGLSAKEAKAVNTELAATQRLYDGIAADAKIQRNAAVDFVTNGADIFGTGQKAGGLGPAAGADFAKSLDAAAGYAKQIQDIQLASITKQAAYEAAQFNYQITLTKRSLADAKGLTGQIVGDEKNLGVLQREQFELSRQSQALGLAQSQRQINFQRAVANFQAPGLSSEEREARIQAAKIEADYAQKQLDIQKKLFALGGKQFQVSAGRGVEDLTRQLALLERGREVSVSTAAAEKKIIALTKLQARENAKVQAYYQAAVDNTSDLISLTGQLAAATGKDMAALANDVIKAYVKVYRGLIDAIGGFVRNATGGYSSQDNSPDDRMHASGLLGMTTGATSLGIAGEAGGEAVAILRNPRPFNGAQLGGGGAPIQIIIQGNTVRSDSDIDEIARKVERVLNTRGAQLGIRPPGG